MSNDTASYQLNHLMSDYLEMAGIVLVLTIGLPLNIYILVKLSRKMHKDRSTFQTREIKHVMLTLRLHLTTAHLFILLFYCPCKLVWLIVYEWPLLRDPGCRFSQFTWLFSFCLLSNIVVCIALDRVTLVWNMCSSSPNSHSLGTLAASSRLFVHRSLVCAWILALLCALPQLFVWSQVTIAGWQQCATVWVINRALIQFKIKSADDPSIPSWTISDQWAQFYQFFHLATVFWIPFTLLLACYFYIIFKLVGYSCRPYTELVSNSASNVEVMQIQNTNKYVTVKMTDVLNSTDSPEDEHLKPSDGSDREMNSGSALNCQGKLGRSTMQCNASSSRKSAKNASQLRLLRNSLMRPSVNRVPAWRSEMRSKVFKTAAMVVCIYCVCWLPYKTLSLLRVLFDETLAEQLSDRYEWFKILILLPTVLNPFIYVFHD